MQLRWPVYVLPVPMSPNFHTISLYDQLFSSYSPFWDKSTTPNDIEHYKVLDTPYMYQ